MFIVNVEGAVHREGNWLIIERSSKEEHAGGLLSLVGGKVDREGTTTQLLERTLKRELYEEVGILVSSKLNFVSSTSFNLDDGNEVINIVFLCEYSEGEAFAKSPDEVESVRWMAAEEIHTHPKSPIWLKESIIAAESLLRSDPQ